MSDRKEPGYEEVEGVDTNLGRLSLGRAGKRWLVYLDDEEMCCGASEPYARCWYGAADFWQDRTAKQGKRGGPFGGETGGDACGRGPIVRPPTAMASCIDPWAEVKP